jgi:hypothetical protein
MNTLNIISPYHYNGTWVFDDAQHGLLHEPFVTALCAIDASRS